MTTNLLAGEAKKCDCDNCTDEAHHRPVLVLHNGRNNAVVRIPLNVVLCDEHRKIARPESFITQEVWNRILAAADARRSMRPKRALTDLVFIKPECEEWQHFNRSFGPQSAST